MIYEYKCTKGHVSDLKRSIADRNLPATCNQCGNAAHRIISRPTFHLDGTDPGFPGAYDKFGREHEKAMYKSDWATGEESD